ncbi:hypothetical protein [Cellulosimicrobium sp. Marseille-Q4280]|uniref:hypothetical protein n=1 Tax=Cellulosimicrobium sp. Marseille-Q4280 TaxID=2937992 RepID=UPI00203A58FD|nr:hypothetical protein [Cellulosimicrobium sp. Marseille-Q4280]
MGNTDAMSDAEAAAYIEAHHDEIQAEGGDAATIEFEVAADVGLGLPGCIAKDYPGMLTATTRAATVPLSTCVARSAAGSCTARVGH